MSESVAELPSFGGSLAVSFVSLGLVCLLAYVGLSWLARRLPRAPGGMRILARHQLEPRRTLYVVDVAGRAFLLGSAETGMNLVAELTPDEVARLQADVGDEKSTRSGIGGLWSSLRPRTPDTKRPDRSRLSDAAHGGDQ